MPPTIDHSSESRHPHKMDILVRNADSQLTLVAGLLNSVPPESSLHAGVNSAYPCMEPYPAWVETKLPTKTVSSAPRTLHRKPVSRLIQRDDPGLDPNLDPSLDPAFLDPNMVWASVVPNPPPPYTPTMALRASTLPPVPNSANAEQTQDMHTSKIATIIVCVILGLLLGVAVVIEASKRKMIRGKKDVAKSGWRFRVPKFPNVRGRLAKGIECLSWNMENGVEMATKAEFDDRTWGTPMHAKAIQVGTSEVETPIIRAESQNSPNMRSYTVPWSAPSYRSSCPPILGTFTVDLERETGRTSARAMSMSCSVDRSIFRIGTPELNSHEECTDLFIGQDATQDAELDSRDTAQDASFTTLEQLGSRTVSVNLTSAESVSTILALTSAAMRSIGKRENPTRGRARQGSDASTSTENSVRTDTDSSSDGGSRASSNTSIATMNHETDEDDEEGTEDDDESRAEGETFELKRVTDSMEVKKGILVALAKGQAGESLPEMPQSAVSRPNSCETSPKPKTTIGSTSSYVQEDTNEEGYIEDSLLHPKLLTKSSTSSLKTMESSTSGSSIDLNDFPFPPTSDLIPSITFTLSTDSGPITLLYQ
ncbi:hypothetical protein PILCRDRAFT_74 [Piloderma croceum F 1598]|uniref:Uncharacterized protein n=1 Tax=Piloderma croceum (strain F 1598) TaxID=765440 RepID=A0A0C3GN00_PILCF|nr:hypothetical protein PILCRDRAFT_74 [Piloderma croceum F 1598]